MSSDSYQYDNLYVALRVCGTHALTTVLPTDTEVQLGLRLLNSHSILTFHTSKKYTINGFGVQICHVNVEIRNSLLLIFISKAVHFQKHAKVNKRTSFEPSSTQRFPRWII